MCLYQMKLEICVNSGNITVKEYKEESLVYKFVKSKLRNKL